MECALPNSAEKAKGHHGFDLKTGDKKWEWKGEGPQYASPVIMTADGVKQVVASPIKA